MKLLTKVIQRQLPKLNGQDSKGDEAIAYLKLFNPTGAATWWITEYDGEDTFFGLVDLGMDCVELGYISKSELESIKGRFGLGIERDMYFKPTTLKEIKEQREEKQK